MAQDKTDVTLAGRELDGLSHRIGREFEKRPPYIAEFARLTARRLLTETGMPLGDRLSLFVCPPPSPACHSTCLPCHRDSLAAFLQTAEVCDRFAYLSAVCRELEKAGAAPAVADLLEAGEPREARVAYVRNPLTDEAYAAFSPHLASPAVLYADGFREACEAVRDGACGYAILPYENRGELLTAFTTLAERYGLVAALVCRVFHPDGDESTHFALYARRARPSAFGEEPFLRFSFRAAGDREIRDVLTAAALWDGRLQRASVSPDEDAADMLRCASTWRFPSRNLPAFLAYLRLFTSDSRVTGLYKETER